MKQVELQDKYTCSWSDKKLIACHCLVLKASSSMAS